MKIIAIAKPNKQYEHYANLHNTIIQARLLHHKIIFYELDHSRPNWKKRQPEQFVKSLFLNGVAIKSQPFTKQGNRDFYAVLYRQQTQYRDHFKQILNKKSKYKRTK